MTRQYLTIVDVLAIHDLQIEIYSGATGLRDPGQLESALFRPQSGYYQDLIAEAAALWESLSQNHPFVDGNKRTALVTAIVFLEYNGLKITQSDSAVKSFIGNLYESGTLNFENLGTWLRANTAPL